MEEKGFFGTIHYFWSRFLGLIDKIFFSMKGFVFIVGTLLVYFERIDGTIWVAVAVATLGAKFMDKTKFNVAQQQDSE